MLSYTHTHIPQRLEHVKSVWQRCMTASISNPFSHPVVTPPHMNWRVGRCGWVKTTHFFVQHTDMMNDFSEQNSYDTLQSHFSPSSSCTSCSFRIRQLCTHISTFHRSTFITDEGTQEARIIRVINVLMKFHLDERNFSRLYIFITFATILDSNITPVSKRV